MNKKLILLMLALPLILMLSLFTATSTVSLIISVPVSKVVVNEDAVVYMDLEEEYEISYTVYPTNAANQKVHFSVEPYETSAFANVQVQDGKIIAESCGKAKITVTTIDGGYQDSFVVEISTRKLQGISANVDKDVIKLGESVTIHTQYTPASAQYDTQLKYEIIEGAGIVNVDSQGKITGEDVGNAKIKVYCTLDNDVFDYLDVTVENSYPMEFKKKTDALTTQQFTGELGLFVDQTLAFEYSVELLDKNGATYNGLTYTLNKESKTFAYTFTNQDAVTVKIRLTVTTLEGEFTDECTIVRVGKIEASWREEGATAIPLTSTGKEIYFNVVPSNMEIGYEIQLSENGKYISCEMKDGYLLVKASETAKDYIDGSENDNEVITLTIWLVEKPNEKITLTKIVNVY